MKTNWLENHTQRRISTKKNKKYCGRENSLNRKHIETKNRQHSDSLQFEWNHFSNATLLIVEQKLWKKISLLNTLNYPATLLSFQQLFRQLKHSSKTNDQMKYSAPRLPQHSLIDFHHHEKIVQCPRQQKNIFIAPFAQILICFIWKTGEQWIFQLKMAPLPFSFFDQSEAEKMLKKTKVNY